jgi:hypothetical protein
LWHDEENFDVTVELEYRIQEYKVVLLTNMCTFRSAPYKVYKIYRIINNIKIISQRVLIVLA